MQLIWGGAAQLREARPADPVLDLRGRVVGRQLLTGLYGDLQGGRLWRVPGIARNHLDGGAPGTPGNVEYGVRCAHGGEDFTVGGQDRGDKRPKHLNNARTGPNSPAGCAELQHIADN